MSFYWRWVVGSLANATHELPAGMTAQPTAQARPQPQPEVVCVSRPSKPHPEERGQSPCVARDEAGPDAPPPLTRGQWFEGIAARCHYEARGAAVARRVPASMTALTGALLSGIGVARLRPKSETPA
jgi:hypothetical protein